MVAEPDLTAVLARWSAPTPVVVGSETGLGMPGVDAVAAAFAAGAPVLIDVAPGLAAPGSGPAGDRLVELLLAATHAEVGFGVGLVPRCGTADDVWALLSGAVAAMTGADVRAALAAPQPAALRSLSRAAREAVRDVVTCVVVPPSDIRRVTADVLVAD